MFDLGQQCLLHGKVRSQHIAHAIRHTKFVDLFCSCAQIYAAVIHFDFFTGFQIIINNQPAAATDQNLTDFNGCEPIYIKMSDNAIRIEQRNMTNALWGTLNMAHATC